MINDAPLFILKYAFSNRYTFSLSDIVPNSLIFLCVDDDTLEKIVVLYTASICVFNVSKSESLGISANFFR